MKTACLLLQLAAVIPIVVVASNIPPSFKQISTPLFILDNTPVGSTITQLEGVATDGANLTFSITGEAVSILRIQQLGPTTAAVVLSATLNAAVKSHYVVTYTVSDGGSPAISRQADLYVTSNYNHPPYFPNLSYETTIFDNVALGNTIFRVEAKDFDSGLWGALTYQFQTPQDTFLLDTNTGNITLIKKLDYTISRYYSIRIIVTDGGGLNAATNLTINVLSSVGHIPAFFNTPYSASVYENASVGSSVLRVSAVDIGSGPPILLTYSIFSGGLGMFDINPTTGWIYVSNTIHWEDIGVQQQGVLEIIVQANQTAPSYQSTRALVSVTVIDINNHGPQFSQGQYNAIVSDCSLVGSILATDSPITVTDLDQGDGGKFQLVLVKDGAPFNAFQVVPNLAESTTSVQIQLKDASFIAQHRGQSFTFDVIASEYLTTSSNKASTAHIYVTVVAVIEIAPVFAQNVYTTTLDVSSGQGTSVLNITASNAASFDVLKYSLLGPSAQLFSINSTTGSIFLNAVNRTQLDPYFRGVVYVVVIADDTRNHSAATLLAVQLHAGPSFDQTRQFVGYLAENSFNFIVPVIVQAIDRDLPPNNQFSYSLLISSGYSKNFRVDASTGNISVAVPLDYEALPASYQGQVQLTVAATDNSNPALNSNTLISIIVQDVNDCAPVFNQSLYTASVYDNSTAGMYVTTVSATDCDSTSPNNVVRYFIERGSRDSLDIDSRTGVITVSSSALLDPTLYGTDYYVTVVAIDGGSQPQIGRCVVHVMVVDVGIGVRQPRITSVSDVILVGVFENAPVNTVFYSIPAVGAAANSRLLYGLQSASIVGYDVRGQPVINQSYLRSLFNVNPTTGSVTVMNSLSRDIVQQVRVVVTASDSSNTLRSATATMVITINAPLVRPPVFLPVGGLPLTSQVSWSAARLGDTVARVSAVNQDSVASSMSYYVIHDSDWSRSFDIIDANRYTGIVTVSGGLYRDAPGGSQGNLTIVAAYSAQPNINSSSVLSIQVVGGSSVNYGGGANVSWINLEQTIYLAENVGIGSAVTSVSATCATLNCTVAYLISAGNERNNFRIDNVTGVIYTANLLDRESISQYNLGITATSPVGSITRLIHVILTDANDNSPVFDLNLYVTSLSGDLPVGSSVLVVRATDADTGVNSVLTYSIDYSSGNGSGLFVIDPISGEISVDNSLLGLNGDVYFKVNAIDRGQPPLWGSTTVRITINSNLPRFISPPENVTVLANTNTPSGTFVVQVRALLATGSVLYELMPSSADYASFSISSETGVISASSKLDPARLSPYLLIVRAYNSAKIAFESFLNVTINVRNASAPLPQFDPTQFPSPFSLSVVEGRSKVTLTTFSAPRVSQDVCFYIIGGTPVYKNSFYLNKITGVLTVTSPLDPSSVSMVMLVVKTTDDCWSGYWEIDANRNSPLNSLDPSLLLVQVNVLTGSQFVVTTLYSAVSREAQPGQSVLQLADDVVQFSSNPVVYSILQPFVASQPPMSTNISSLRVDPFIVGPADGTIRTNVYFQSTWSGYFQTVVAVSDANSNLTRSKANVTIYVLENYQRILLICRGTPDVIGAQRMSLTKLLSNISLLSFGIDSIKSHVDTGSQQLSALTDVYAHAINSTTGQLLNAIDLQSILRASNDSVKDSLIQGIMTFDEAAALQAQASSSSLPLSGLEKSLIIALAIIGAVLLVTIAIMSAIFCIYRRRYQREVKAADAMAATTYDKMMWDKDSSTPGSAASRHQPQLDATPSSDDIFAGTSQIWLDRLRHDPYQQFADTDTDSSKNSSEDPPVSSTSASTVALERQSPNVIRHTAHSSPSVALPKSGTAQENGIQANGSMTAVHLDPETGLWVYRDADGNKRPVAGNGHAPAPSNSVPNSVFDLHSTNV